MDSFELLGPIAGDLHFHFRNLYYVLLPIFLLVALVVDWAQNPVGGPNALEILKRTFIATLLLVAFVEIADSILAIANGISERISDMSGLNTFFAEAGEKARSYPLNLSTLVFGANDLLLATISYLSFFFLYIARYLMLAIYHFGWTFLTILAPLLLLFHLFTPKITLNLFRSLVEIASWQIVWSVLSVMLRALPFGDATSTDGSYITLIIMNFVVALAMLLTPILVHTLVGSGFSAMAGTLGGAAAATMVALPAKVAGVVTVGRNTLSTMMPPSSPGFSRWLPRGPNQGMFQAESPLSPEPGHRDVPPKPTSPSVPGEPAMPAYDPSLSGFNEPTRK